MIRNTVLMLGLVGVLLVGCAKSESEHATENVFRYPLVTRPTRLDPARVQDGDTIDLLQQVFEGLVKWSPDNKVVPNLAEKWEVSDGGTLYRFTIKPGVKFHNGDELTAQDFVYSIDRACSPELKSETAANYLFDIVGAKDRKDGKAATVTGVRAPSKYILEIQIDQPKAYFLAKLTYPNSYAVNRRAIEAAGGGSITKLPAVVGTGPFTMSDYNPDSVVKLKGFVDYHGGKPKLDGIERPIIIDASTRFSLYEDGQIDLLQLEKSDLLAALKNPKLSNDVKYFERPAVYYVGLNTLVQPEFKDIRVRQAFAMALDKDAIIKSALQGNVSRADCIVPPGIPANDPTLDIYPYNVQKARGLLAQAGFPGGKGFPTLTLNFRDGRPDVKHAAEVMQQQLKANLGISVELQPREWGAYLDAYNHKSLGLFHMRWAADYLDPQDFLSIFFVTDGPENKIGYSHPEVDRLCRQADIEQDQAKRIELYKQAQNIVLRDAPWVPIYFQRDAELIRPKVKGIRDMLLGHLPHTETYIEK